MRHAYAYLRPALSESAHRQIRGARRLGRRLPENAGASRRRAHRGCAAFDLRQGQPSHRSKPWPRSDRVRAASPWSTRRFRRRTGPATRLGIRGIRFFMLPGGALPWEILEALAARVAPFGWHAQLQLDGRDLPEHEATINRFKTGLVIDHVGKFLEPVAPDHPGFRTLLRWSTRAPGSSCRRPTRPQKSGRPITTTWAGSPSCWPRPRRNACCGRPIRRTRRPARQCLTMPGCSTCYSIGFPTRRRAGWRWSTIPRGSTGSSGRIRNSADSRRRLLDASGEGRADMTGKHQRAACRAIVEHLAPRNACQACIGVLREVPVGIIDLQQMVPHVADEGGALPLALELEEHVTGRRPGAESISMKSLSR